MIIETKTPQETFEVEEDRRECETGSDLYSDR